MAGDALEAGKDIVRNLMIVFIIAFGHTFSYIFLFLFKLKKILLSSS